MEAPGTKVMAIDHHFQTSMENCACNRAKSCTQENTCICTNNAYRMNNSRGNETEGVKFFVPIRWFVTREPSSTIHHTLSSQK